MTSSEPRYIILAAVQFDETGEFALHEASRIAQRNAGAELHLVHVATPSLVPEAAGESTAMPVQLARAPQKLREHVDRACAGMTIKIVAHIRSGTPHQEILQTAADLSADMIVLGTHQRSGVAKLVLGSVAERVLREAHCPVLIALPKSHAKNPAIEPPCPDCLNARNAARDPEAWCERHSRTRLRAHVYEPSADQVRASVSGH